MSTSTTLSHTTTAKYLGYLKVHGGVPGEYQSMEYTSFLWRIVISSYFDLHGFLTSDPPELKLHKEATEFFGLDYAILQPNDTERISCVILVEAIGANDPRENRWSVEHSSIYGFLRDLDDEEPNRETLGILAAGVEFLAFKVVGTKGHEIVIGSPENPAHVLDSNISMTVEKAILDIMTTARQGNCKSYKPEPQVLRSRSNSLDRETQTLVSE